MHARTPPPVDPRVRLVALDADSAPNDEHEWIGYEAAFPTLPGCYLGDAGTDAVNLPG